ncbi:MAG: hypothetical protein AAGC47_01565 [Bacteroidota bacterium]
MNIRILVVSLVCVLSWNCSTSPEAQSKSVQVDSEQSKGSLPKIGFNCKASYNIIQQTAFADELFSELNDEVFKNMVLRIPGGTRSQKDFAVDWPDEKMKLWTDLQKKYGYTMVYVVNGNDTPQNQLEIIRRWQKNGAEFEFLEMMTEYYLPKFSKPNLSKPEVTRRVDEKIYTEEILPTFYNHLDSLDLPYFLIFAPAKKNKMGQERYASWNDHMIQYVNEHEGNRELGAVLHLYQKDYTKPYDFAQISRLRNKLPSETSIAVTELGVLDGEVPLEDHPAESIKHISGVLNELNEADYLMDQVLFHDYRNGSRTADLHPMYGGISPKGRAVIEYYNSLFE